MSSVENISFFLKKIIPRQVFLFFRPFYHWSLAFLAALFYGFPSRKLKVIGVTGTNGKTTVVHLLGHILRESGFRVASVSSLEFRILGETKKNNLKMTMPGRFFIQKFFRQCVKNNIEYIVLEVTSEGIKQFRHKFIKFNSAVLTNVTPEHIESHGNFEKYLNAKISLFRSLARRAVAVINQDDPSRNKFLEATQAKKVIYCKEKITWAGKDFRIRDLSVGDGINFFLDGASFKSPLLGEFNFYNILATVAVAISQDLRFENIRKAVESFSGVSGRLEFVQKEPFSAVVDYAHTPDSLRKVYETLRSGNPKSEIRPLGEFQGFARQKQRHLLPTQNPKLICVLGATGGGRDKWKRPEFGRIAEEFCDEIILTNEDPYDEKPEAIIDEIASGFSQILNSKSLKDEPRAIAEILNYKKIIDRREAISEAIQSAKEGDTVIITGKGAEPWMMGPNGTKITWDDRAIVRKELAELGFDR